MSFILRAAPILSKRDLFFLLTPKSEICIVQRYEILYFFDRIMLSEHKIHDIALTIASSMMKKCPQHNLHHIEECTKDFLLKYLAAEACVSRTYAAANKKVQDELSRLSDK